jgi:hypothetical protein
MFIPPQTAICRCSHRYGSHRAVSMAIVDHVNWRELDRLVEVYQRNREVHTPVISSFRWWARRPHAVGVSHFLSSD